MLLEKSVGTGVSFSVTGTVLRGAIFFSVEFCKQILILQIQTLVLSRQTLGLQFYFFSSNTLPSSNINPASMLRLLLFI